MRLIPCTLIATLAASAAQAQPPQITDVTVARDDMGWQFNVTILHRDTGWDHYADGWDILDANGNVLASRTLYHPHVDEQPFTRSLRQVILPDGTRQVFIRAHCSDGEKSAPLTTVDIPF